MRIHPGNDLNLGTVFGSDKPIVLSRRDRARHTYITGSTRTGKTKLLELMARQDMLQYSRSRCPMVVIDPHGTLHDSLVGYAAAENLKRLPIIPIDLRQANTVVSYNMLRRREGVELAVVCRGFVDAILHSWGQSNSNDTPRLATWLYAFITFACERDCTLIEALHLIRDPAARDKLTDQVEHFVARTTFQSARSLKEREFQDRVESTLYRINRFLSTRLVRAMLCQTSESLDLYRVITEGGIVLACLSTEGNHVSEEDATTLGSVLLTDLWLAAKRRGKREEGGHRPCYVYLDEFQNYVTPMMAKSLSEMAGFGIHFAALAHQFPSQLSDQGDLGKMVLNSVLANAKNKIVFQLSHPKDVEMLASVLYRQDVDPDQVKDEIWQTKVMGHSLQYLPSYSTGKSQGTEQGWQRSHGSTEGYAVGNNWTHTDTVSESTTAAESTVIGTTSAASIGTTTTRGSSSGLALSNSHSLSESYGSSESRGDTASASTGTSETDGTQWSKGSGHSGALDIGHLSEEQQADLRRYEYSQLDGKGQAKMRRLWPDLKKFTAAEADAFKRRWPRGHTLSNGTLAMPANSWGESSNDSSGGNRSTSRSSAEGRSTSLSRSQTHGVNRQDASGETRSQGASDSHADSRSLAVGTNEAVSQALSVTLGTSYSDAYGGSETRSTSTSQIEGESGSTSRSESEGTSFAPMLMPIMGRELSSRQFRSVEEQLYTFAQLLDGLPDRHCVVRLASMPSPVRLYTRTVRKPLSTSRWITRWTFQRLAQLPFTLSMEDALRAVAAREQSSAMKLLLDGSIAEPSTARRRIRRNPSSAASENGGTDHA